MTNNSSFATALKKESTVPRSRAKITIRNISPPPPVQRFASVYLVVKDGRAFIESNGKSESGLTVTTEPIFECPLELEAITTAVTQVAHAGYRLLSHEELDRLLNPKNPKNSPILKATRSTSWRSPKRSAAFYSIQTLDSETKWVVFLHNPTKKARYISQEFPISTPFETLIEVILEDVKKYPYVLSPSQ